MECTAMRQSDGKAGPRPYPAKISMLFGFSISDSGQQKEKWNSSNSYKNWTFEIIFNIKLTSGSRISPNLRCLTSFCTLKLKLAFPAILRHFSRSSRRQQYWSPVLFASFSCSREFAAFNIFSHDNFNLGKLASRSFARNWCYHFKWYHFNPT